MNNSKLYLQNNPPVTCLYNFEEFEKLLNNNFFCCDKSHYVNLDSVRKIDGNGFLMLLNGDRVPIAPHKIEEFLNLFM